MANQAYERFVEVEQKLRVKKRELDEARMALRPLEQEVTQLNHDWSAAYNAMRAAIPDKSS